MNKKTIIVIMLYIAFMICVSTGYSNENLKNLPYMNPKLPLEERIEDLLNRMTDAQKVKIMKDMTPPIAELGIPGFQRGEGLHGLSFPKINKTTVFPQPLALASSFNPEMAFKMGDVTTDEARAQYHHGPKQKDGVGGPLFLYAPNMNMARDPRWGRTGETYGEDPFLVSRMGVAYIKGFQGDHPKYLKAIPAPKHFVANNEENIRYHCNAKVSEKWLREYYFAGFRACIIEGEAKSIMTAYNALNGIPCALHKWLLEDILRKEWGFDGYAITDAGALNLAIKGGYQHMKSYKGHDYVDTPEECAALGIKAGTDFELGTVYRSALLKAIRQGLVERELMDQAVRRILTYRFKLGIFDPEKDNPYTKIPFSVLASPEHKQIALEATRESMVLLKNDPVPGTKNKVLPIDLKKVKKIAVIGPNAEALNYGAYSGIPKDPITALDGIRQVVGNQAEIKYVPWKTELKFVDVPNECMRLVMGDGTFGWEVEYFNNRDLEGKAFLKRMEKKIYNRWAKKSPIPGLNADDFSVRWRTEISPTKSGEYLLRIDADDAVRLTINGKVVIDSWDGKNRRPQIVPYTMDASEVYKVVLEYRDFEGPARIIFGWHEPVAKAIASSEEDVAKESDVVIAIMGFTLAMEGGEAHDRGSSKLPLEQITRLQSVLKANPNTVVVVENGGPITLEWIRDNVPAILEAWYPGEQGGRAIADVLFGEYNPGGKLPITFVKNWDDLPPFNDYNISNNRTYMYTTQEVIYPFGYGLSYTTFKYNSINMDKKKVSENDTVTVDVNLSNTGGYDGDEIVQLYIRESQPESGKPQKRLKAFKREHLKKGETKTIKLSFKVADLWYFDEKLKMKVVYPGSYDILIGASSQNIKFSKQIEVIK